MPKFKVIKRKKYRDRVDIMNILKEQFGKELQGQYHNLSYELWHCPFYPVYHKDYEITVDVETDEIIIKQELDVV